MPIPLSPNDAWFAEQLRAAQTEPMRMPHEVSADKSGKNLLSVYQAGDLAILRDADGEFFATAIDKGLDLNWIMDSMYGAFYDHYEDDYQYVCFFLLQDFGVFFAFYQPMANDTLGIGYDNITPGEVFDMSQDTQVDGLIFMNYYGLWKESPAQGRYVFGQEFMHRWGAFTNIEKEGVDADELLGRDTAHWSYWLDTTNSPMEGNDWVDNGDGTWTIDQSSTSTYSDLDLYLMGLVPPDEVGPQTLLQVSEEEQLRVERDKTYAPEYFGDLFPDTSTDPITVTATPVSFTLDDIVTAEGTRYPAAADAPKNFRMAFVILAFTGDEVTDTVLGDVDTIRQRFESEWEEDVGQRADLDTTLGNNTAATWGETDDTGPVAEDTAEPTDSGAPKATDAEGCGCASTTGASAMIGGLAAMLAAGRRRRG